MWHLRRWNMMNSPSEDGRSDTPGRLKTQPSIAVVETVATVKGVSPVDLDPPLATVIDPEALDRLFTPAGNANTSSGIVEFRYCGYTVTVRETGDVEIQETS